MMNGCWYSTRSYRVGEGVESTPKFGVAWKGVERRDSGSEAEYNQRGSKRWEASEA